MLRIISRVANNFQNFTRKHNIAQYLCERINWWKKYVHITSKNVQYKHHFAVKQLSSYTQISQKGENLLLYHTPLPQDTASATGVEGGGVVVPTWWRWKLGSQIKKMIVIPHSYEVLLYMLDVYVYIHTEFKLTLTAFMLSVLWRHLSNCFCLFSSLNYRRALINIAWSRNSYKYVILVLIKLGLL